MSLPSPWSVKGVQPKTREAAKDLARREGLTLGEWLNRLIGDVDEEGPSEAPRQQQQQFEHENHQAPPPPRATQQQSYREDIPLAQFPSAQRDTGRDSENSRLTAALEQLTRRLDATMGAPDLPPPPPHYQAPTYAPPRNMGYQQAEAVPFAAAGMMDRLEATERRAETALGRVDASLSDVRQTQAALAERMRIMEANDPTNKSLQALKGLETALNRLSEQVFETQNRTQVLDENVEIVAQRVVNAEAIAQETNTRLKEAMVDLSARISGVEQTQDDPRLQAQVSQINDRVSGMEDITTQAIESVDKGLGLVSERVAATEALAQATNERLVEALIDLSARLVQLESIDTKEQAREVLSAIEAKNKELTRRLETLDQKIDTTRGELTEEVKTAVATGVDGRMAEIAKALADRLDMSERRSGEALEKIGAEMARASISLDQRLREIEERGTEDVADAMRNEMAKMANSIDERMQAMERRDAMATQQANGHIQQLAQSLGERLDASEARAQHSVQHVSSQMEQLALRLQARQDETAKNLVARMEEGEARSHHDLKTSVDNIAAEIRAAEDRAKAVSAPLHRDFNQLVDRLDQVEATGMAPYAETIGYGGEAVTINEPGHFGDQFGEAVTYPDPATNSTQDASRRAGFGSPFPGTSNAEPATDDFAGSHQDDDFPVLGTPTAQFNEFDEGPFLGESAPARNDFDDGNAFADDFNGDWEETSRPVRGSADYLANARLSANRAAAEKANATSKKAKPLLGATKKKSAKKADTATITDASGRATKVKPVLSPVGMVAAAALVVTTGVLAVNHFTKDTSKDEKPSSLTPAAPATTTSAPAPNVAPATPVGAQTTAPVPVPSPTSVAPVTTTPATTYVAPVVPRAQVPQAVVPNPVVTPHASAKPSAQSRQFQAAENARADQAATRAKTAQSRLTPVPTSRATPQIRPFASPAPRPAEPRPAATRDAQPVRVAAPVPFPVPIATPAAPRPVQVAAATPVPRIATPQTSRAAPPSVAPAARAPATGRAPTPRIAAAPSGPTGPVTAANVRQVFDQAVAKQQAGDLAGAAALMRAAADTGDARSIQRLAKMYERGEGVARDPAQARALTERAASRGNSQAMHNLGVYYAEGEGAQRDLNKAAENFRRAAQRGVTDSQFNLGAMAEQGLAGPRSDREAYYWYSVAGRSGDRDAASKARELAARLPAAERAAEDQRAAQFRAEPSSGD